MGSHSPKSSLHYTPTILSEYLWSEKPGPRNQKPFQVDMGEAGPYLNELDCDCLATVSVSVPIHRCIRE